MSYLTTTALALIRARIAQKTAQLVIANATYDRLLAQDTLEYRLNTGEGSQWATKRAISEISKQIENLEAQIDNLNRQLNSGAGLIHLVLRRQ